MRLFISYSSKDGKNYAKTLSEIFKSHGHDPFIADHCVLKGENLWDTISKECLSRDQSIFVITPSSIESKGQKQEYDLAVSFYRDRSAFMSEKSDMDTAFERFPLLKPYLASFFNDSNFEKQCKALAAELVELQDKRKIVESKGYKESNLPELSDEGLDKPEIENCIRNLHEAFQEETIIPEICRTGLLDERSARPTTLGFAHRLPIQWFTQGRPPICNDFLFREFGRDIALGERDYFHHSISSNAEIHSAGKFSPEGVLKAIERIRSSGFEPDLIFPPIDCWVSMHHWHNGACVEYDHDPSTPRLNASLTLGKCTLGIVPPLGKVPDRVIVFSKQAITWHVQPDSKYGALFISMGKDRLYPMKYVELITGTRVKCEIDPKGISTLEKP